MIFLFLSRKSDFLLLFCQNVPFCQNSLIFPKSWIKKNDIFSSFSTTISVRGKFWPSFKSKRFFPNFFSTLFCKNVIMLFEKKSKYTLNIFGRKLTNFHSNFSMIIHGNILWLKVETFLFVFLKLVFKNFREDQAGYYKRIFIRLKQNFWLDSSEGLNENLLLTTSRSFLFQKFLA